MKVRALCATGLLAAAIAPAGASANNSIPNRLHRADVALNHAQDAADAGNDAGVVSGLKGATRQTNLALKSALRMVKGDRNNADQALSDVTDQQDANALAAMDLLDGASSTVVTAVNTTLIGVDTGRGQILSTIQGLGDNEVDWGDSLTQVTDDIAGELSAAGDNYGTSDLTNGEDTLTAYVSHETDAANAIFAEVANIGSNPDAQLDGDNLDNLESDVADAHDSLAGVTGTSAGNATAITDAVTKLDALDTAVGQLADAVNGASDSSSYDDSGYWDDNSGDNSPAPSSGGSGSGVANVSGDGNNVNVGGIQIIINNYGGGWAPRHHGGGYGHYLPDNSGDN
jgi:hypothetical protein